MSTPPTHSSNRKLAAIVVGVLALLAIGFFVTKSMRPGQEPTPFVNAPEHSDPNLDASIPAEGDEAPAAPEPNVLASPAAPAAGSSTTEQNGTGSLIPVTAMPDSGVYDDLILALAKSNTEIGRVANASGTSFEAKACRAYALATTDQPAAADSLIADLKGTDTDLRQQSFLLVAQAEVAYRRRDVGSAGKLFDEAVQRATEIPEGTEGAALANLASARFYAATGNGSKAKACAEAAAKQANTVGERELIARYQ